MPWTALVQVYLAGSGRVEGLCQVSLEPLEEVIARGSLARSLHFAVQRVSPASAVAASSSVPFETASR